MKGFVSFIFLIVLVQGTLLSYPTCVNSKEIDETCVKETYKQGEYDLLNRIIKNAKIKKKSVRNAIHIHSLYKTGKYDLVEKYINRLGNEKDTLYYRLMLMRSYFARKRFHQTLEMIDGIKEDYPLYYLGSNLECKKADISLYRHKYPTALELYDICLEIKSSDAAAFNRIIALEKNRGAKKAFLKDYIEFVENYPGSIHSYKVVERLIELKKKHMYPNSGSSYYTRWVKIFRKNGKLDVFFENEHLELDFPSSTEIIKYLKKKKRYADALKIIDRNIEQAKKEEDLERIYHHVREVYRLYEETGELIKAAEFMVKNSEQFSEKRNDRLKFFAALNYYKAEEVEKAKAILEKIVFNSKDSKYFLLSLYKLGLIYMDEGNEIYAYSMWSNYLSSGISARKYFGGHRVYKTLKNLTDFLNRTHDFCTFTFKDSITCEEDYVCIDRDTEGKYISYYDLLYHHLTGYDGFKHKYKGVTQDTPKLWKKNFPKAQSDRQMLEKRLKKLLKYRQGTEHVKMMKHFLDADIPEGLDFYFHNAEKLIRTIKSPDVPKDLKLDMPEKEALDEIEVDLREVVRKTSSGVAFYLGKTGDMTDWNYRNNYKELGYSPYEGDKEVWKLIYPTPYFDDVMKLSLEFKIPPQLIYSIMRAETFYREGLTSGAGAVGLMQVMPKTFEKISKFGGIKIKDPFDPYESMKASAWYLSKLLKRFDGDFPSAIAAYNAGPIAVSKWENKNMGKKKYMFVEMIPYYETRNYVKKVLRFFLIYSYLYENTFYDVGLNGDLNIEEHPEIVNF